jgi:hypothetical protein
MTPDKLEKIRKLAADVRGDPATRAIAQAALKRYAQPPQPKTVPGIKPSAEHDRYAFMDVGMWRTTANGNPTRFVDHKGRTYRIVIFKHKKTPTWGWMRIDVDADETEFSGRFSSLSEAHRDSWQSLMTL